jgi:hypothetical protein
LGKAGRGGYNKAEKQTGRECRAASFHASDPVRLWPMSVGAVMGAILKQKTLRQSRSVFLL